MVRIAKHRLFCAAQLDLHGVFLLFSGKLVTYGYAFSSRPVAAGIAWDAAGKRLFVTGKYWPRMYQVKLRRLAGAAAGSKAVADARSVCIPKIAAVGWR